MKNIATWFLLYCFGFAGVFVFVADAHADSALQYFEHFCSDCHDDSSKEAGLDLSEFLNNDEFDGTLVFENLITGKMPPKDMPQPKAAEKNAMLQWLAGRQVKNEPKTFRRVNREEFVHSISDLLGSRMTLVGDIPDDRETHDFDSSRQIQITREMLAAYLDAADTLLDFALPDDGFFPEQIWEPDLKVTSSKFNYARPYRGGVLFAWWRHKKGSIHNHFLDGFTPPIKGWYQVSFDAAKQGDFAEDISMMVFAGKHYQDPALYSRQRLLGVISLSNREPRLHSIRAFLYPGESVSVACHSKHTYKMKKGNTGAWLRQFKVAGPVYEQWPPPTYQAIFRGLELKAPRREGRAATPQVMQRLKITVATAGQDNTVGEDELKTVISRFAQRAFASSLTEYDLAPYFELSQRHFQQHRDFIEATKVGLKAILGSHRFLLRPGEHANPSYARAASLALALWRSVPDERLLNVARDDALSKGTLRKEIERMLDDPKSRRMIESLCAQWLNLRSFNQVAPSLKLYPHFGQLLGHYMPIETEEYVAYLMMNNRPVRELIDSNYSILNQRLAQHYGIDGVTGQQMRKVSFAPESPRGGLLTMASILQTTTDGFDTSPILRGAWISKNIAGTVLSPPPENIPSLETKSNTAATLREQIKAHKENERCYACHRSIDPYGFALENFDATGHWRTRYREALPHSKTFNFRPEGYFKLTGIVDATGEIDGAEFSDVRAFKKILASNHKKIAYNFAKTFFEYVNGHVPDLRQRHVLHQMIPDDAHACRLKDLMVDVLSYSLERVSP